MKDSLVATDTKALLALPADLNTLIYAYAADSTDNYVACAINLLLFNKYRELHYLFQAQKEAINKNPINAFRDLVLTGVKVIENMVRCRQGICKQGANFDSCSDTEKFLNFGDMSEQIAMTLSPILSKKDYELSLKNIFAEYGAHNYVTQVSNGTHFVYLDELSAYDREVSPYYLTQLMSLITSSYESFKTKALEALDNETCSEDRKQAVRTTIRSTSTFLNRALERLKCANGISESKKFTSHIESISEELKRWDVKNLMSLTASVSPPPVGLHTKHSLFSPNTSTQVEQSDKTDKTDMKLDM